ncbi:hypothetical protein HPY42_03605 [Coprothermobacteraceae bacterium]|nr:hypothetical protein [Coprothermobacteraceae bacterium]
MILVLGGTSGGHTIPALVMAKVLRSAGYEVVQLEDESRIEWKSVRAVLTTGSRKSLKIALEAKARGKPLLIHEQNVIPGKANRLLSKVADVVLLAFEESRFFFSHDEWHKLVVVGMPVRQVTIPSSELRLKLRVQKPLVLVTGGSQGSAFLNFITEHVLLPQRGKWFVIHQAGASCDEVFMENYMRYTRLDNLQDYIAAADVVLSRAGSSTMHECLYYGTPAIFFPMAYSPDRHQWANAEVFLQRHGYTYFWEHVVKPSELLSKMEELIGEGRRTPVEVFDSGAFVRVVEEVMK